MNLNDSLDVDRIDATVRRAFLRRPQKLLLQPGVRLYRWTNEPVLGTSRISPWWSFVDATRLPNGELAEGLRVAEERARRIDRTHREFDRSRAAISDEFRNTMSHLIVGRLTTAAWGLAGQASGQPEFAKARQDMQNVVLIGGAHQIWIPNLTAAHLQQVHTPP